ncbi:MAG: hypothetical protein OXG15_06475 [Gammaproteobacteria bacterium]|nr:hypothetical protein [Gammaproteobacteria bacterium]
MDRRALITIALIASFLLGIATSHGTDAKAEEAPTEEEIRESKITDARAGYMFGLAIGQAIGTYTTNVGYRYLDPEMRDAMISGYDKDNVCSLITATLDLLKKEDAPMMFTNDEAKECVATFFYDTLQAARIDCSPDDESWGLKAGS